MTNDKSSFNLASALGVAIVFLAGCEDREPHGAATESLAAPESGVQQTASRLKSHMEFLADDRLGGRYPGDIGYDVAALYVETRLRSFGVGYVPGYDSYLDPVSLVRSERDFTEQKLRIGSCEVSPDDPDLVFGASMSADGQEDVDAAAVFVGYGIEAPEYNMDDYAGVDVDGKVAVFLNGFPSSIPGEVGAHYVLMKTEFAAANGAIATLELETHASLRRRTWELIRQTFNGPTVNLEGIPPQESPLAFRSSIRTHGAISECLFTDAPKSLEALLAEADVDGALPSGFALNTSVSYQRQNSRSYYSSPNVLGMIPATTAGQDAAPILLIAHLDHLGVVENDSGDHIYNGALDNAAGVSVLLEIARELSQGNAELLRPIIFAFVSAEESGMIGSAKLAADLDESLPKKLAAVINVDMPMLFFPFEDVVALGANHSDLGEIVDEVTAAFGLQHSPDPSPEQGSFTRSDHYRFVQEGVPALSLRVGTAGDDAGLGADFYHHHYHQPSDDLSRPIDWTASVQFTEFVTALTLAVSNSEATPRWYTDSIFGQVYAPDAAKAER